MKPEKPAAEPGADAAVAAGTPVDDPAKTVPASAAKTAKTKAAAVKS